ncbi:MAG: hypothetical protein AABX93_02500, partial [Nanoarchaeota archaeon]
MRNKTFALFALSALMLTLVVGAISAAIVLTPNSQILSIEQGTSTSFTFTINNTASDSSVYDTFTSQVLGLTGFTGNVSVGILPTSLNAGITSSIITVTVTVPLSQSVGVYTGTISVDADGIPTNPNSQTIDLSVTITPTTLPSDVFSCITTHDALAPNLKDNLDVSIDDITVDEGFGGEDNDN